MGLQKVAAIAIPVAVLCEVRYGARGGPINGVLTGFARPKNGSAAAEAGGQSWVGFFPEWRLSVVMDKFGPEPIDLVDFAFADGLVGRAVRGTRGDRARRGAQRPGSVA